MKKKDFNVEGLNELLLVGNKILKLCYYSLLFILLCTAILIGGYTNIFYTFITILSVISPMYMGFIFAWLISPIISKLEEKGFTRTMGSLLVYSVFCVSFIIVVMLFIPVFRSQVSEFISIIPRVGDYLTALLDSILKTVSNSGVNVLSIRESFNANISEFGSNLAYGLPSSLMSVFSNVFSKLVNFVLSLVIGLYILIDYDNIKNALMKFIPKKYQIEAIGLITEVGDETRKCVNGILFVSIIVFVCNAIGFSIVGLDAAILIALLCGITNLIPYIGPFIGGGIAVIVGFSQSVIIGISAILITVLVQVVEFYMLQPVVMNRTILIHPIIIMVSLLLFGYFFGIVGMIISTPILTILKVVLTHFNKKYEIFDL